VRPLVIHILPALVTAGAERIVASLAVRLPGRGFDSEVWSLQQADTPLARELRDAGVKVVGLGSLRFNSLGCSRAIRRNLPSQRPLILHGHLFHANLAARLSMSALKPAHRVGVHVLSTIHVIERRFRPWQFMLDRLTSKHAFAEVCVSKTVAEYQQQRTGLPMSFFRVIDNGIDVSKFRPVDASPSTPRYIFSAGRLDPQKDFPTLLRAWAIVSKEVPDIELRIAGAGAQDAALRALSRSLNLPRVHFLGLIQNVHEVMRGASLYVQTSLWEGLPLAVMEAMATGLPVVVTDGDGFSDVVNHNETGLIAPRSNPVEVAASIIRLLKAPDEAARLGAAAHRISARFDVERMVDLYCAVYHEAIETQTSSLS